MQFTLRAMFVLTSCMLALMGCKQTEPERAHGGPGKIEEVEVNKPWIKSIELEQMDRIFANRSGGSVECVLKCPGGAFEDILLQNSEIHVKEGEVVFHGEDGDLVYKPGSEVEIRRPDGKIEQVSARYPNLVMISMLAGSDKETWGAKAGMTSATIRDKEGDEVPAQIRLRSEVRSNRLYVTLRVSFSDDFSGSIGKWYAFPPK